MPASPAVNVRARASQFIHAPLPWQMLGSLAAVPPLSNLHLKLSNLRSQFNLRLTQ